MIDFEIAGPFLGLASLLVVFLFVGISLRSIAKSNPSLQRFQTLVLISFALYLGFSIVRILLMESVQEWSDGSGHHLLGVEVAGLIEANGLVSVFLDIRPGNPFFQKLIGLIYFLIGGNPESVLAISAGLGFIAIAMLLDIAVRIKPQLPSYYAAVILFLPSALFWTPLNLKEGPMLWCIVVILRTLSFNTGERLPLLSISFGAILGMLLRPHILLCWVAGLGFTLTFRRFSFSIALVLTMACIMGVYFLELLIPGLFSNWQKSLNEIGEQSMRNAQFHGGSAISERPIPFITGSSIIFLRPYPWEVFDIRSLFSGLEIWGITAFGIYGWVTCSNRLKLAKHPIVMASIVALICLSLPFSYFYNLGLAVRERLQAFPGLLVVSILPNAMKFVKPTTPIVRS